MKKKVRAAGCAVATVLAFTPFLVGCAAENANNAQEQSGATTEESATNEQDSKDDANTQEAVEYAQVMAVNGNEITVVLGELAPTEDGTEEQFSAGQQEVTFDITEIEVVDESGNKVEDQTLSPDQVVIMSGTGEGSDFKPQTIQVIEVSGSGESAIDVIGEAISGSNSEGTNNADSSNSSNGSSGSNNSGN